MEVDELSGDLEADIETDYGSAFEADSDFVTDDDDGLNEVSQAAKVLEHVQQQSSAQGVQPYELVRQARQRSREERRRLEEGTGATAADDVADGEPMAEDNYPDLEVSARKRQGYGRRARQRRPTHISRGTLPPQGAQLVTQATVAIASGDSRAAVPPLQECIRLFPNFTEPYTTLAAAFAALEQWPSALQCYVVAMHMKPSDATLAATCAELSQAHQFYRQAVWAWNKVIRGNRRDYAAAKARLEAYAALINQQEAAGHSVARDARKMQAAARQMLLRDFEGDPFAAEKLPWVLYKVDEKEEALKCLSDFFERYPGNVQPVHTNMLAQLHMERDDHSAALAVLARVPGLGECLAYVDLAAKVTICQRRIGDVAAAAEAMRALCKPPGGAEDVGSPAVDLHDLYLAVAQQYVAANAAAELAEMLPQYVASAEDACAQAAAADAADAVAAARGAAAVLNARHMAPLAQACDAALQGSELGLRLLQLVYDHGDPLDASHVQDVMQLRGALVATGRADYAAAARALVAELEEARSATESVALQAKLAEAYQQDGDEEACLRTVCSLLDTQVSQAQASERELRDFLDSVEVNVRRRLQRMPTALFNGADDGSRSDGGDGGGAGASVRKDRRSQANRDLDMTAQRALEGFGVARYRRCVSQADGVRRLLEHPGLFPMLFQAMERRAASGEQQWALDHCEALLTAFRRGDAAGPQQRRTRAMLRMLALRCRVELGSAEDITAAEQRSVFAAWPYSVQAWSLFSECCHRQDGMPVRLVARLAEAHPDSVPLRMLRAHALMASGQLGSALEHYLQVYELLPDDPVVLLCVATAYLSHAMSRAVGDRHATVLKAAAFLERYAARAANRGEAAFNVGRALHGLGLRHLAVEWYERALLLGAGCGDTGLPFEAGHNLALIYEASGAVELALRVRATYCCV